jgi:hypothetical protein
MKQLPVAVIKRLVFDCRTKVKLTIIDRICQEKLKVEVVIGSVNELIQ